MSFSTRILALAFTAALAGCNAEPASSVPAVVPSDALRVRTDVPRGRAWVLGRQTVSVHESLSGRELARVALPGWLFVDPDIACPPDLALGGAGDAYISSNVVPVLWRIDGQTFEVTRIELSLDADHGRDVGFSTLSPAADGRLLAASTVAGSLWGIDALAGSAEKLMSFKPVAGACELDALLRASGYPRQWLARSGPG